MGQHCVCKVVLEEGGQFSFFKGGSQTTSFDSSNGWLPLSHGTPAGLGSLKGSLKTQRGAERYGAVTGAFTRLGSQSPLEAMQPKAPGHPTLQLQVQPALENVRSRNLFATDLLSSALSYIGLKRPSDLTFNQNLCFRDSPSLSLRRRSLLDYRHRQITEYSILPPLIHVESRLTCP